MIEKEPKLATAQESQEILPFQRMYPIIDLYRKAPNKVQFMAAMKKNGIRINEENVTPIDFFAISDDLTDAEMIEAIEGYLGVGDIEESLELINESLDKARDFIENYLHVGLSREIKNMDKLKGTKEILKIFKKTAVIKKGEKIGFSPSYCMLVSVFAAAFEFKKGELDGLLKESEYVYEKMIRDKTPEGTYNFHKLQEREGYDKIAIYDDQEGKMVMAESYFRGKSEYSFMAKLLNKPEANTKEASKDGIGIKFELASKRDIRELIPFLNRYFKEKFGAKKIVFENTKLFRKNDKLYIDVNDIIESENPHTNKNFKAFKINGELEVPKDGDKSEDAMIMPNRQFEIQIVLTSNKNESGYSKHSIYEASKKLAVYTRILGSFTEEYLDIICREVSRKSGLSANKIKRKFVEEILLDVIAKGSQKKRYVHKEHAERHKRAGIIPNSVKTRKAK